MAFKRTDPDAAAAGLGDGAEADAVGEVALAGAVCLGGATTGAGGGGGEVLPDAVADATGAGWDGTAAGFSAGGETGAGAG